MLGMSFADSYLENTIRLVGTTLIPIGENGGTSQYDYDSQNMHSQSRNVMVSRVGLEPTTLGLKVRCSTRLSYRPTMT